jgi:putative hemolysin
MIMLYEILTAVSVGLLFFFSLSEIAVISANRAAVMALKERKRFGARAASRILDKAERTMSMILIGSNIATISSTAFITFVAVESLRLDNKEMVLLTAAQTVLFLVFCEALPKIVARFKADSIILVVAFPLLFFLFLLSPLVGVALSFARKARSVLDISPDADASQKAKDEIDSLFRLGSSEGIIEETNSRFVNEILSLHRITVLEAMTPTIDIKSIEVESPVSELLKLIQTTRFSRIPVYRERVDNIIGYIHYRDIIDAGNRKIHSIEQIMRAAVYVPSTKTVYSLYRDMIAAKNHIVFVVTERGAVEGVVTREDIAEEIVGEIQTRDHPREDLFSQLPGGKYSVSGSLDVDHFARVFKLRIDKKGFEAVSGFVSYLFGYIPSVDEKTEFQGLLITVVKGTNRAVERVEVTRRTRRKGIIRPA